MVYESLPIKITHHDFSLDRITYHNPRKTELKLVWRTLPGLKILRTCREIKAEAYFVIGPKLEQLKSMPARLIANRQALRREKTIQVLESISKAEIFLDAPNDLRKLIEAETRYSLVDSSCNHEDIFGLDRKVIEVALQETRTPKKNPTVMFRSLRKTFRFFRTEFLTQMDSLESETLQLAVWVRPFRLSDDEERALGEPYEPKSGDRVSTENSTFVQRGDQINTSEWQEHWTEGERAY